jgi:hypothetical protein
MVLVRATHRGIRFPEDSRDGGHPDVAWGVGGLMAEDILPDRPTERRKRRRFCAMRAMERLGLLGEENLIPTLCARPKLRWLADEEGARWDVLAELGRIGDPATFDEAVAWALRNRPSPEQAEQVGVHVRRLRAGEREASEARGVPRRPRPTRRNRTQQEGR